MPRSALVWITEFAAGVARSGEKNWTLPDEAPSFWATAKLPPGEPSVPTTGGGVPPSVPPASVPPASVPPASVPPASVTPSVVPPSSSSSLEQAPSATTISATATPRARGCSRLGVGAMSSEAVSVAWDRAVM